MRSSIDGFFSQISQVLRTHTSLFLVVSLVVSMVVMGLLPGFAQPVQGVPAHEIRPVQTAPTTTPPRRIEPNRVEIERPSEVILMPDRVLVPPKETSAIDMTDYQVRVQVVDNVATTTIEQTFKNTGPRTVEAKYWYPLPEGANFSTFALTLNGKTVEGELMEKEKAKAAYTETVRKFIDPGLLEYVDHRTVQLSIAPFFAGETKRVQLSYSQILEADGGLTQYKYPFVLDRTTWNNRLSSILPTHVPRAEMKGPQSAQLNLTLKTAQPLKTVMSATHTVKIERTGDNTAKLTLDLSGDPKKASEKNFSLYFGQDTKAYTMESIAYQPDPKNPGYFLLTLRSPQTTAPGKALPKNIILVLDTSGSMSGQKIDQAKSAMTFILDHLQPTDRFNMVTFDTDVHPYQEKLLDATPLHRKAAVDYVSSLSANGGTNIEGALQTALAQAKGATSTERPTYIIFLTDGEPTVGNTNTEDLVKILADAKSPSKLFVFGVGYDVNTRLLGKLSDVGHGSATYVEPSENLELALTQFYEKIAMPVLANVTLDFQGIAVDRMYPKQIGDLFTGSELVLLGRFKETPTGTTQVVLKGDTQGKATSMVFPIQWSTGHKMMHQHPQLPRLWAGRRIADLLESIQQNGENPELKDEVVSLSKQFGILTPYTAYLAMEPSAPAPVGSPPSPKRLGRGDLAAPAAMSQMREEKGSGAVQMQKALQRLKSQSNVADSAESEASMTAGAGGVSPSLIKTVGTKTFVMKYGCWIDTQFDEQTHGKPMTLTFGTPEYFGFVQDHPDLRPYLQLGPSVLILFEESGTGQWKAVEVVLPEKT